MLRPLTAKTPTHVRNMGVAELKRRGGQVTEVTMENDEDTANISVLRKWRRLWRRLLKSSRQKGGKRA
jgi:hypothetical protein